MKEMGPVAQGTLVSITFKGYKNSNTDFFIEVYIDSEEVIDAGTATTYMFYGK